MLASYSSDWISKSLSKQNWSSRDFHRDQILFLNSKNDVNSKVIHQSRDFRVELWKTLIARQMMRDIVMIEDFHRMNLLDRIDRSESRDCKIVNNNELAVDDWWSFRICALRSEVHDAIQVEIANSSSIEICSMISFFIQTSIHTRTKTLLLRKSISSHELCVQALIVDNRCVWYAATKQRKSSFFSKIFVTTIFISLKSRRLDLKRLRRWIADDDRREHER